MPCHERVVLLECLVTLDVKDAGRLQPDGVHAVKVVTQRQVARQTHHVTTGIIGLTLVRMLEDDAHDLGLEAQGQLIVVEVFQPLGVVLDDALAATHVAPHVVVTLNGVGTQHGKQERLGEEPVL